MCVCFSHVAIIILWDVNKMEDGRMNTKAKKILSK